MVINYIIYVYYIYKVLKTVARFIQTSSSKPINLHPSSKNHQEEVTEGKWSTQIYSAS